MKEKKILTIKMKLETATIIKINTYIDIPAIIACPSALVFGEIDKPKVVIPPNKRIMMQIPRRINIIMVSQAN